MEIELIERRGDRVVVRVRVENQRFTFTPKDLDAFIKEYTAKLDAFIFEAESLGLDLSDQIEGYTNSMRTHK